jgi:hypothetical protein
MGWIVPEKKNWAKIVDRFAEFGIKPSKTDDADKHYTMYYNHDQTLEFTTDNFYLTVLFKYYDLIKDQEKKIAELETKLREQAGWLASKELQDNLRARMEAVEKKLERKK